MLYDTDHEQIDEKCNGKPLFLFLFVAMNKIEYDVQNSFFKPLKLMNESRNSYQFDNVMVQVGNKVIT